MMTNFRVFRKILFLSISAIVLSQVITSCSKSTWPVSSNNIAKVKSFKGLHTSVKSSKNNSEKNDLTKVKTNQKNKISAIDHNEINFSDNPIETENNEELDLTASNKNDIVLSKKNIYKQVKNMTKTTLEQNQMPPEEFNIWLFLLKGIIAFLLLFLVLMIVLLSGPPLIP